MRIIIANKYYYMRGGDCIYVIELEKLLKEKKHQVAIFSMEHPSNLSSDFSDYFPVEIDYNKKDIPDFFRKVCRPFGTGEVIKQFEKLINDFKPDILHLNNIHTQLSPVIAEIAYKNKIPVVWTLHDGKLVCPAYLFLSNNVVCETCITKTKLNVVKKKCIKNSYMASLLAYFESVWWNKKKLLKFTNLFITPSHFLMEKLLLGGFKSSKIRVINNFVSISKYHSINAMKHDYYCYIGRLSSEKGIEILLEAAKGLPDYKLKIIGTGPLENELKNKYKIPHIEFLGYKCWNDFKNILALSKCMVMPSYCYENNPVAILESLCLGTPVIGADIGGIPELIKPGVNGMLFEAGNIKDLQNKIHYIFQNSNVFKIDEITSKARSEYSSEIHYNRLIGIYSDLILKNY